VTKPLERNAGEVLDDRYRLVRRLGRGGFGDVWRAEELLPDGAPLRDVALKLLRPELALSGDWTAEARIIASLRHDALVTVYAAGIIGAAPGQPFVAMELLMGESLSERVARGEPISWRRALAWAREAASALDVIHRAGVVHLDLKPANLFLDEQGRLKVLDFGIAKQQDDPRATADALPAIESDDMSTAAFMVARAKEQPQGSTDTASTGATITHAVVGTPGFMAPEIFVGGEATPAADAYALAACVVQLCTGRLPQRVPARPSTSQRTALQSWFAEVHTATVRGHIRSLANDHAELPDALVKLLLRWLALDPMARQVGGGDLEAQLDEVWICPHGIRDNPFRGLAPYRLIDEGTLYGRELDAERCARELELDPSLVLHGTSGSGVSSLACAGIVPELARRFADGRDDWTAVIIDVPRDNPGPRDSAASRAQLLGLIRSAGVPCSDDVTPLTALTMHAQHSPVGTVVVVDGLDRAADQSDAALLELVSELCEKRAGLRLIAICAEEQLPALLSHEQLGDRLRRWLRFVGPLTLTNLAQCLKSASAKLTDEQNRSARHDSTAPLDSMTEELRTELDQDGGTRLPFVSLALTAWWESKGAPAERWRAIGGVIGALGRHANQVLGKLSLSERERVDGLLLSLVSSDGSQLDRPREALVTRSDDPKAADETVALLLKERLVVERQGRLRIAHPKLSTQWQRLVDLRLHHGERLTFVEGLREASSRWVDAGRDRSALWGARELRAFAPLADELTPDLGPVEHEFVAASRRRIQLKRLMHAAGVLAVAIVIIALWTADRAEQRRQREQQAQIDAARRSAAIGRMVTRSRRTNDPYMRVAWLAGAIELQSPDPMLPLELYETAKGLPAAKFLSLEPVPRPTFPWGERWLLGGANEAVFFDFEPPASAAFGHYVARFRPHSAGMYDFVPMAFDSAFVTRGLDGELRVWRVKDDGRIALAAVSPMRCLGGLSRVLVAERAPVIACSTSDGLAHWDLAESATITTDTFQGRSLHLSDDGRWLAAARLDRVLLWNPNQKMRYEIDAGEAPTVARFSPRDSIVALARPGKVELRSLASDRAPVVLERDTLVTDLVAARWAPNGIDLALCGDTGRGEWLYLRPGGRAPEDGPIPTAQRPCEPSHRPWPKRLYHRRDYGSLLTGNKPLGPREWVGGWQTEDARFISRDLVMFDLADNRTRQLLSFRPHLKAQPRRSDSIIAVYRDGDDRSVWGVSDDILLYDDQGKLLLQRRGRLHNRCEDGQIVASAHSDDGKFWKVFDARMNRDLVTVARKPGFLLGVDPSCQRLFIQWLDGQLASVELKRGAIPTPLVVPGAGYVLGGYVYDARPSAGGGDVLPGMWMALGSGAIVRVDAAGTVTAYGHATGRALALADGQKPGELLFSDASGVVSRHTLRRDHRLLESVGEREWEDLHARDDNTLLLSSSRGLTVFDLERGEIVGEVETPLRGRIAPWDAEGSVLLWRYSFMGPAGGDVVPFGRTLSREVAAAVANLAATLDDDLRPRIVIRH